MADPTTHFNWPKPDDGDGAANTKPWGQKFRDFLDDLDAKLWSAISFAPGWLGSVARAIGLKLGELVSITDFGAIEGADDNTEAIQAALNFLSQGKRRKLYVPFGVWKYRILRAYYHPTLNPGFKLGREGHIHIVGDGWTDTNNGVICGSDLSCINTTGNGFIVWPTPHAKATLGAAITSAGQTAITLATGTGQYFPDPSTSESFPLTINDGVHAEIVRVTARSGDNLTVLRGQDGTTAVSSFANGTPVEARITANDFMATGVTFSGVNSGFLVVAAACPGAKFKDCQLVQNNPAGSGLLIGSPWFATLDNLRAICGPAYGATSTGTAIRFTTFVPGGLFTLRDCDISHFAYGLDIVGPGGWQNLSLVDSEISGTVQAVRSSAYVQLLEGRGSYFEGAGTFIGDTATNCIEALKLSGCWFLGLFSTNTLIDLHGPASVQIDGCFLQDPRSTFLNIADVAEANAVQAYTVNGLRVRTFSGVPSPVTLFTGIIPSLFGVDIGAPQANLSLYGAGKHPLRTQVDPGPESMGFFFGSRFMSTHIKDYGTVPNAVIDLQNDRFPAICWVTAGGTLDGIMNLPPASSGIPHGFSHLITSKPDSTKNLIVKDGTTIATLTPGSQRLFVFINDGVQSTGWR